jgi:hypothetical protein
LNPAKRQFLAAWVVGLVAGITVAAANPSPFTLIALGLVVVSGVALIPTWPDRD